MAVPQKPAERVCKLGAGSSSEVVQICESLRQTGATVIGIVPNMDRTPGGGYAMNYVDASRYYVFAISAEEVSEGDSNART